jgi:regulator of extracellular matrix RemA (YlzA/DUF370 family)
MMQIIYLHSDIKKDASLRNKNVGKEAKRRACLIDSFYSRKNITLYLARKLGDLISRIAVMHPTMAELLILKYEKYDNVRIGKIGEDDYLLKIEHNKFIRGPKALMMHIIA